MDGTPYTEADQTVFGARLDWETSGGQLRQRVDLRYSDTDNANFDSGINISTTGADKTGLGYQATWIMSDAHQLTVALEHEETDFAQRGAASPFGDPNQDQSINTSSAVLEYLGELRPDLNLAASVRRDRNSDFADRTS